MFSIANDEQIFLEFLEVIHDMLILKSWKKSLFYLSFK